MINLNISLTSLAVVLWSGMLIIAGSIWVLSSQVRKLSDLLEEQGKTANLKGTRPGRNAVVYAAQPSTRKGVRRGSEQRSRARVS